MKVQSYSKFSAFEKKCIPYLVQKESLNNLFWEVMKKMNHHNNGLWMGNVFHKQRVGLSAVITPSSYVMLSTGDVSCINSLVRYGKRKKWRLKGVTGPDEQANRFYSNWMNLEEGKSDNNYKEFCIFEAKCAKQKISSEIALKKVDKIDWPRIRLWTKQFASESNPAQNEFAIIQLAKEMMNNNSLFILKNKNKTSCGMGGFGRTTQNKIVVNLVFVPPNMRGRGYAGELVRSLLREAEFRGFREAVLFSDYKKSKNLYERIGFQKIGNFCERPFD